MKANLLTVLLLLLVSYSFGQTEEHLKKVPRLEIVNHKFDSVMKETLVYLKQCKHFSESLAIRVEVLRRGDSIYFDIQNSGIKDVFLSERAIPFVGYFILDHHFFYVFRDLDSTIFNTSIETKEFIINGKPNILTFEDNVEWLYAYKENNFSLLRIINECK